VVITSYCATPLTCCFGCRVGNGLRSEKFPWNRLGTASIIPRKKMLIPRHSEVYEKVYSKLGTEGNGIKKISFTKNAAPENRIDSMFSSETCFGTEFRVVSSAQWFGTEFQVFAYIFVPWNGIPSCFLFRGKVQNGIPSVCF
jgi:hypothetical protein